MTCFVDTSALLALLDRSDRWHEEAGAAWAELLGTDAALVTSNYVLVEAAALAQRRLGMGALRDLDERLGPVLDVHWLSPAEHRAAMSAVLAAGRRGLSFVDCASFEVMRGRRIEAAFTFDPDFEAAGFTVVPGASR